MHVEPDQPLFPKLEKLRAWLMVKKDLEKAGIPYRDDQDRVANFHAAGCHTHMTELLRNGASVPEAKMLARHSDVRMTMKYTHIGIQDQAKTVAKLPAKESWLHYGCSSEHADSHKRSSGDTRRHRAASENDDANPDSTRRCDTKKTSSHKVAYLVKAEDTGLEPATHCWAIDFESTCLPIRLSSETQMQF